MIRRRGRVIKKGGLGEMPEERTTFDEEQVESTEACLERLLTKSKAVAVLLTGVEGQPLGQVGRLSDRHKAALSTLAAGSVGATVAMAKLLGQAGTSEKPLFEEKDHSVYSSAVAQNQS